jgi:hypothetical protein
MTAAAVLEEDRALWFEDARATIVALSLAGYFTADDFRKEMRPSPSVYWPGLAFGQARRAGLIEAVNTTTSTAKSRNYGSLKTWRRKINEGVAA